MTKFSTWVVRARVWGTDSWLDGWVDPCIVDGQMDDWVGALVVTSWMIMVEWLENYLLRVCWVDEWRVDEDQVSSWTCGWMDGWVCRQVDGT